MISRLNKFYGYFYLMKQDFDRLGRIVVGSHGRVIVFDVDGGDYTLIIIQVLEHGVSAYSNVTHVYITEFSKIFLIETGE